MLEQLETIQTTALTALVSVTGEVALNDWRVTHLGRSSAVMAVFQQMGQLSKEERPLVGQAANQVKKALETALEGKTRALKVAA